MKQPRPSVSLSTTAVGTLLSIAILLAAVAAAAAQGAGTVPAATTVGSTAVTGRALVLVRADRRFIQKPAHDSMAEVDLGKIAQQHATDAHVNRLRK